MYYIYSINMKNTIMKNLKNIFIQSNIDDNGNTTLEIGSTITEEFDSIPHSFSVMCDKIDTRWIFIHAEQLNKLLTKWNVTSNDVITALEKQFEPHSLIVRIR